MHQQGRLQLPYFRSSQVIRCIFKSSIAFCKLSTRTSHQKCHFVHCRRAEKFIVAENLFAFYHVKVFGIVFGNGAAINMLFALCLCVERPRCNVRVQRDSVNAHTFHCVHPKTTRSEPDRN